MAPTPAETLLLAPCCFECCLMSQRHVAYTHHNTNDNQRYVTIKIVDH